MKNTNGVLLYILSITRSHLEQCVPSQCRLQSESPAGANPVGIVSDRHTASAGRAAPNPQMGRLTQRQKQSQICYGSKTPCETGTDQNVTHQRRNTAAHPGHLQRWSFCTGWGCPGLPREELTVMRTNNATTELISYMTWKIWKIILFRLALTNTCIRHESQPAFVYTVYYVKVYKYIMA